MVIAPKTAAPGAIKRWLLLALDLINRNFHSWMALAVLSCLVDRAVIHSPALLMFCGLMTYLLGVSVAALLDDRQPHGLVDILKAIRQHALPALKSSALRTLISVACVMAFISASDGYKEAAKFVFDPLFKGMPGYWQYPVAILTYFTPGAFAFTCAMASGSLAVKSFMFHYPCMTLLGLSWKEASVLSGEGEKKNAEVTRLLTFTVIVLSMLFLFILPLAAPLLFCLTSAFSYVAFREVFLGIGQNKEVELRAYSREKALQSSAA